MPDALDRSAPAHEAFDFDAEKHPRDEKGRWESGEGGEVIAYHATTEAALEAIKQEGITVGPHERNWEDATLYRGARGQAVFVASTKEVAMEFAGVLDTPVILEVRIPKEAWRTFKSDASPLIGGSGVSGKSAYSRKDIKPEWIKAAYSYHYDRGKFTPGAPGRWRGKEWIGPGEVTWVEKPRTWLEPMKFAAAAEDLDAVEAWIVVETGTETGEKFYSEGQERDEKGRWTSGGEYTGAVPRGGFKSTVDELAFDFKSQVEQYEPKGPKGVSYVQNKITDLVPGTAFKVDTLLYRDAGGKIVGILNHYPQDIAAGRAGGIHGNMRVLIERKGAINILVDPKHQGEGIGTNLIREAGKRFNIDLAAQDYTKAGAALANRAAGHGKPGDHEYINRIRRQRAALDREQGPKPTRKSKKPYDWNDPSSWAALHGERFKAVAERFYSEGQARDERGRWAGAGDVVESGRIGRSGDAITPGEAPKVNWEAHDLEESQPSIDEAAVRVNYLGRDPGGSDEMEPVIYGTNIPLAKLHEELNEEDFPESDRPVFDWTELRSPGDPPPIKVFVRDGSRPDKPQIVILDGNHRVRHWKESGYKYAPAWVLDYRAAAGARPWQKMSAADGEKFYSENQERDERGRWSDGTNTPGFDAWFTGSKVIDPATGSPLKLYHGTSADADFTHFEVPETGVWFTEDPVVASHYAKVNDRKDPFVKNTADRVIPVYVKAEKVYRPGSSEFGEQTQHGYSKWFNELRAKGYDAIHPRDGETHRKLWVFLGKSENIKSAISNRTFDPTKRHIGMSAEAGETFEAKPKPLHVPAPDISRILTTAFSEGYHSSAAALAASRGAAAVLSEAQDAAAAYADDRAGSLITDIDETTEERVQGVIASAVQAGESDKDVADRLENLFGEDRADLIARNEMATAWNTGVVRALKDAGEEYVYVFDGEDDDEECRNANGEIWTLEEAEANPLAHVNCQREFRPCTEEELAEAQQDEAEGFSCVRSASHRVGEAFAESFSRYVMGRSEYEPLNDFWRRHIGEPGRLFSAEEQFIRVVGPYARRGKFYSEDQARDEHGRWVKDVEISKIALNAVMYQNAVDNIARGKPSVTSGPIILEQHPKTKVLTVNDGYHRIVAAHARGETNIKAEILLTPRAREKVPNESVSLKPGGKREHLDAFSRKRKLFYSEDQARDDHGRWTAEGAVNAALAHVEAAEPVSLSSKPSENGRFMETPLTRVSEAEGDAYLEAVMDYEMPRLDDERVEREMVPIASLRTSQEIVKRESLTALLKEGNVGHRDVVVWRIGGVNILRDGNHRASALKLLGVSHINARVIDIDKLGPVLGGPHADKFYAEDQARAPAGSPDGGEFVSSTGATGGGGASPSGVSAKVAEKMDEIAPGAGHDRLDRDPDIDRLANHGREMSKTGWAWEEREQFSEPHECHTNVAKLYATGGIDAIATGYAFAHPGHWTQHSWGLKGGKIVETTFKFDKYFGVELTGRDAMKFAKAQGVNHGKKHPWIFKKFYSEDQERDERGRWTHGDAGEITPPENLYADDAHVDALVTYAAGVGPNEFLRHGRAPEYYAKEQVGRLDDLVLPSSEDRTLYRVMADAYAKDFRPGTEFTDDGFCSTSMVPVTPTFLWEGGPGGYGAPPEGGKWATLEINAPKGTLGIDVNHYIEHNKDFQFQHQRELVISRGTRFRVDSVKNTKRGPIFRLSVVSQASR